MAVAPVALGAADTSSIVVRRRIARNGRLVIPKELREKADLREGDYVQLEFRDGEIVLAREPGRAVEALREVLSEVWPREQSSVGIQRRLRSEWRERCEG